MMAYLQLCLWSLGPAVLAVLADRFLLRNGRTRDAQIVTGLMFGVGGALANTFGIYLADVDATVCARDAFSIVSAFWFGPLAGSVTTLVVAAERAITPLWGVGAASWIRSSAASFVVGGFAVVIGKYLFRGERPVLLPAALLAAVAEVIHLAVVFLFGMSDISNTLGIVDSAMVPMMVVCALAATVTAIGCGTVGSLRRNILSPAGGIAIFYGLSMLGTWGVGFGNARYHTLSLLDFAENDLVMTADEIVNIMLEHSARVLAAEIGSPRVLSAAEGEEILRKYDFDEISVIDANGVCVFSTDPTGVGVNLRDYPESRPFMVLTNGVTQVFAQPFRASINNPGVVYKYLGVAFPGGNGFVQLGYSDRRLSAGFVQTYGRLLSDWPIGETGYYLYADESDTCVIVSVPRHSTACGQKLSQLGIGPAEIRTLRAAPEHVAAISVMGERCFVRYREYAHHCILIVVPAAEYYGTAMQFAFAAVAILFIVFVVFGYLIGHMVESGRRIAELHAIEEAKRENDMLMAKSIQSSALPAVYPPFPGERRIDIYAQMTPAREVGGDFYDFYMLDANRLVFLVADVSGKGIPAAMFMMKAKATLEGSVKRTSCLADAVVKANHKLAMGNDALMFVTCWIGVLRLDTGELSFVNAGHNPPFIRRADGTLERLATRSGLTLAACDSSTYTQHSLQLGPGDMILLYTDGVTEAMNAAGEQFFESRLGTVLRELREADPSAICRGIKEAVDAFAAGNTQSDDITILSLFWRGTSC